MEKGLPSKDKDSLFELKAQYLQNADTCCETGSEINELNISTINVGDGEYYCIETSRWCFDDINDLVKTLTDFKERFEK